MYCVTGWLINNLQTSIVVTVLRKRSYHHLSPSLSLSGESCTACDDVSHKSLTTISSEYYTDSNDNDDDNDDVSKPVK